MFWAAYHFEGDPAVLVPGYDALLAGFPPGVIQLQVCVTHQGGLTVYDACPSREEFAQFSAGAGFAAAVAAAGLPAARAEPLGEIHHAVAAGAAAR